VKILITGSNGFIGKNLAAHLKEKEDIELVLYDREDNFSKIEENILSTDFIFHFAGINRPESPEEFYAGNTDFTKALIQLLGDKALKIPIVLTSSIQAKLDNDYGKSKKLAEEVVLEYGKSAPVYIYRLHNVFGKWGRPNYNSAVATFCYNISHDLDIKVNDESTVLELVYIDDIVYEFIGLLDGNQPSEKEDYYYHVSPHYQKTLGEIVTLLYSFKESMKSIYVPATGHDFEKKLYATFISYLSPDEMIVSPESHTDVRGTFTELVRTFDSGQFAVSTTKPGYVRGNHYHHTKLERFMVVKGKAMVEFESILDGVRKQFFVDDSEIKIITMPVGYIHSIKNIGDEDMILLIWGSELFNPKRPDTIFKEITKND
jgi:UDP-2-acetamido-2,6-beta-L-arabino-hexul-4-ose reductase